MKRVGLFTCESVSSGHPDKMCDAISDAILDACLEQDPYSRVACETTANKDTIRVIGEITTKAEVNYEDVVRQVVAQIGYDDIDKSFDYKTCNVIIDLNTQSHDIDIGVSRSDINNTGAGDQGMMFGYACDEYANFMPYALEKSHALLRRLEQVRKLMPDCGLYPDAKSQVTVEYGNDGKIKRIHSIVLSTQHSDKLSVGDVFDFVNEHVISPIFDDSPFLHQDTALYCNPTGRFVVGGPLGDAGLTGRKIIVDTYGGYAPHGGGAFSGKDATKVDRTGAYIARYIAKNIVAAGLANECTVQLAYVIGVAEPVSFNVYGVNDNVDVVALTNKIRSMIDMRPNAIIERFDLRRPIFRYLSAYGHFGRNGGYPWEKLDIYKQL